ncbi:hypothetical protein SprV_0301225100 [Sparganum proliferum]
MAGSPVGTRNRLSHLHVPLLLPPDEDIVQQIPVSRPRVHPGGLPSQWETVVGVGQVEAVFCADSWETQATVVGAVETMGTQSSSPGSMACAEADVEVTKDS